MTKSTGAQTYFTYLNFLGVNGPNALNGIKTLSITPSYSYSSKNSYQNPTAGKSIFFSIKASGSVLGANVNTIQPTFDGQYYHASPALAQERSGVPPAGHDRHRVWRQSSAAFHRGPSSAVKTTFAASISTASRRSRSFPAARTCLVLNPDGSQRVQKTARQRRIRRRPVQCQLPIPTYQVITPGGDTHAVFNFEYRIPVFGPITLVPFFDAGMNRIMYPNQLTVNPGQVSNLNAQFPSAAFTNKVKIAPGTQATRMSTGLEIDVVLPIVQAPFRVYYSYNPVRGARIFAAADRGGPFDVPEYHHVE